MGRDLARIVLVGENPEVLPVIEDFGEPSCECSILVGLDGEEILRVPQDAFSDPPKVDSGLRKTPGKRMPVNCQTGSFGSMT